MSDDLHILCGDFTGWSRLAGNPLEQPFSADAIALLDSLSRHLVADPASRLQAELVALAFWLRRANLELMAERLSRHTASGSFVARGTVFHIAPSNVATIAIYSWSLGLLTGNRNVVRISSRAGEQSHMLVQALQQLMRMERYARFRASNLFVSYPSGSNVTADISQIADVRVIWGGDQRVAEIRSVPLPAASIELTFADRHSLAVIGAHGWLASSVGERDERARRFLNDTLSFGQMACSSPRRVYWLGEEAEVGSARDDFWQRIAHLRAAPKVVLADADQVEKLVAVDTLAMHFDGNLQVSNVQDLVRVWFETHDLPISYHCGGGLYFECRLPALADLGQCLDGKVQTLSYAGLAESDMLDFLGARTASGPDRVVPFGSALDFSPVWDGIDILRSLTREISFIRDRLSSPLGAGEQ